MGPCVRLVRALVAQPDKCKEENKTQWEEFKNTVKSVGWKLTEQKIVVPAPDETRDNGLVESYSTTINVGRLTPITDNDQSLVGKATMTYDDGTTEEVHLVHKRRCLNDCKCIMDTIMLTPTKDMRWVGHSYGCKNKKNLLYSPEGTSVTTAVDGTKSLGVFREYTACGL